MRLTVGIYPVRVVPVGNVPKLSILSHGTMGWDGQLDLPSESGTPVGNVPNRPSYPVVLWDGMDSWDLPSEGAWYQLGMLLNHPSCPVIIWYFGGVSGQYFYVVQSNGILEHRWTSVGNA